MSIDTEELRKVAEAASPGPWRRENCEAVGVYGLERVSSFARRSIADCSEIAGPTPHGFCGLVDPHEVKANATHIATFDPPTVLALLAEIDRLRGADDGR